MNLHSMSIVLRLCRRPLYCYGVGIQCVDHCTRFLQTKVAKDDVTDVTNPEPTPASKRKKSGASANKQNGRDDKPKVTFWR